MPAAACVTAELTEYTSVVVPDFTTSIDERAVTWAIVFSDGLSATRSACVDRRNRNAGRRSSLKALLRHRDVYVSGASESNAKCPERRSTVAVCDGLTARTRAPAIGAAGRADHAAVDGTGRSRRRRRGGDECRKREKKKTKENASIGEVLIRPRHPRCVPRSSLLQKSAPDDVSVDRARSRAARNGVSCRGWPQEAALRMLRTTSTRGCRAARRSRRLWR